MGRGVVAAVHHEAAPFPDVFLAPRVAGVLDPLPAVVERPRRNDDGLRRYVELAAQALVHEAIRDDDTFRMGKDPTVHRVHQAHRTGIAVQHTQPDSPVRVQVVNPVAERNAAQHEDGERCDWAQRGRRAHQDYVRPSAKEPAHGGLHREGQRSGHPGEDPCLAERAERQAPHLDPAPRLPRGIPATRLLVAAIGREHQNLVATIRQRGGRIVDLLARGRRVRHVGLGQDQDAGHRILIDSPIPPAELRSGLLRARGPGRDLAIAVEMGDRRQG